MRLVKVSAPQGKGEAVAQVAFSVGISEVSLRQEESLSADGKRETKDAIDLQASTPKSKRFVDALLAADFYDQKQFTINTRQPRAIVSREDLRELTQPLVIPASDIYEELWQFSHVTVGFVARNFIAACLLAYGLIEQNTLVTIAGLLFLTLLPLLLAIGFGGWTRQWKLTGQGALAFLVAVVLLVAGGALVAAFSSPPVKYDQFSSLPVAFLISLAVGAAAGFANVDDVGRRELIGLAATSQLAIIPVWFGICFVFGFPATTDQSEIIARVVAFFMNMLTIIVASLAVYVLLGAASRVLGTLKTEKN